MIWYCLVLFEMNKNNLLIIEWCYVMFVDWMFLIFFFFIVCGFKCCIVFSDSYWWYGFGVSYIGDNCCYDFYECDIIWFGVMSVY